MPKSRVKSQESRDKNKATKKATTPSGPRRLPLPKRIWYKPWTWRRNLPAPQRQPLPKARQLLAQTARLLWQYRKLFGGIIIIYGVLNLLFVRGLSDPTSLTDIKDALSSILTGASGQAKTVVSSFLILLTTSGSNATPTSGTYQSMLLFICSLAFIWALRQTVAGKRPRVRDSFYLGMYPLIPFLVVVFIAGIQLLPAVIGGYLYSLVVSTGIAKDAIEQLAFGVAFVALTLWSLRMITATTFALYIVTLPDMTPLRALRSARELVYKRRLLIWRKLTLLPVALLLVAALIEVPFILFWTPAAYWVFFVYSMAAVAFFHGYLYTLYRKLL